MRGRRRISGGRVTIPRDGLGTWLAAEHMAKSGGGSNVLISLNMGSEGLLDYVAEVRREHGEGPLFPRLNPNRDGRRGDPASRMVSRWMRNKLGIKDERIAPNHSWRHTFESIHRNYRQPHHGPLQRRRRNRR